MSGWTRQLTIDPQTRRPGNTSRHIGRGRGCERVASSRYWPSGQEAMSPHEADWVKADSESV